MLPARHHLRKARRKCVEKRPIEAVEARRAATVGSNVTPAIGLRYAGSPRAAAEKNRLPPEPKLAARKLLLISLASLALSLDLNYPDIKKAWVSLRVADGPSSS